MIGTGRKRKWLAGLLALVIAVAALLATARWNGTSAPPLLDGSTITVAPGIHLIGGLGPAAAYVVETPDGLVLIDAGLDGDARLLKAEMARLGLGGRKLRAILLTHVHGDHCGGAEHLRSATGATVYAGKGDAPLLRAGAPRDAFFSTFKMPDHSPHPTTVDIALDGDEKIAFGDVRFRVLATPGHTPGSTCYLMERGGLRALFAGDVIVRLGEKPLGTYSTYLAPRYRGDARSYLASLQVLRALPVPDLVLPGHPRSSAVPQSPRLTPQHWKMMLDDGIGEMEQLVARFEADGAAFLDGHPKRLLPDLYYLGDFKGAAVYGFFVDADFFVVDAPGGPGLGDFLKAGLRQLGQRPVEPTAILLTNCTENETAGLSELVERSRAQVIASPAAVDEVVRLCPPGTIVASSDELPHKGWFSGRAIPLGGRGVAPVAYLMTWAGKTVLFSGRIPTGSDQASRDALLLELGGSRKNSLAYLSAIRRLAAVNPELWLPATPTDGQNANLYGSSWKEILEKNYQTGHHALQPR